jgi:uncharacterized Zn finger protein
MWWNFEPRKSVGQRKAEGKIAIHKLLKGKPAQPVVGKRGTVATTFWGKAWVSHIRSIGEFESRLDRGRAIAGNGTLLHMEIEEGVVRAYVAGSELYSIGVKIQPLKPKRWEQIKSACAGNLGSMVELLQGKFSDEVMRVLIDPKTGMFPSDNDFDLDCSCPDWTRLCKHLAGVLFAVGAKLDQQPELLFTLRGVNPIDLIQVSPVVAKSTSDTSDVLDQSALSDVFGVDFAGVDVAPKAADKGTSASKRPGSSKKAGSKKAGSSKAGKKAAKRASRN